MATTELTVAYPGREGAHSAAACDRLFPAARLVPLPTFSDVADAVTSGRVPFGVLPIESSLVGPVAETHDLLYESSLSIVAEAILPVNHCLVGPSAVELAEVREIHSHPVALDQCRKLLASLPNVLAVASPTTGDAASTVAGLGDPTVVAIASDRAARINGLTIIDGTSATTLRRTRGSSRSRRTRASTDVTASGARPSRSRPITGRARCSMRSSRSRATGSTSTSSSRGRSPPGRSATGSTPSSAVTRSTRRSRPRCGRCAGSRRACASSAPIAPTGTAAITPRTV